MSWVEAVRTMISVILVLALAERFGWKRWKL